MATIIDGKKIAAEVRGELKEKIEKMVAETKRRPALAVILVGEDPASKVYVRNKAKACEEIGVASEVVTLAADITQEMLEYIINSYAARVDIDGILVRKVLTAKEPLPAFRQKRTLTLSIRKTWDILCAEITAFCPALPQVLWNFFTATGFLRRAKNALLSEEVIL